MPGTYTQILLHIVFATKAREPWITPDIAERLHPYLGGIIRSSGGVPIAIGGVADHVHLYLRWRPDAALSDLMRTVKSRSSRWVHESFAHRGDFAWQEGYAAFSVSPSQDETVRTYIANQEEHHRERDFKSELLALLKAHGVEFEERYAIE